MLWYYKRAKSECAALYSNNVTIGNAEKKVLYLSMILAHG